MIRKIELHQAFFWICDDCGIHNFERAVLYESSDEEINELKGELGVQPWEDGVLVTTPQKVKCTFCRSEFETE